MPTNDFLPFAGAGGANVLSQADYAAEASRLAGVIAGIGRSNLANKSWRQSAAVSSMLGKFIVDYGLLDALDNGDIQALEDNFAATLFKLFPRVGVALTLYVRPDGNDANNGLTNTAGGAFLTIAAAINAAQNKYFLPPGSVTTIKLGNTGNFAFPGSVSVGAGLIQIVGDLSVPSNTQIVGTLTGGNSLVALQSGNLVINSALLNNLGTSGYGVSATNTANLTLSNCQFFTPNGSTSGHVWAAGNSTITLGSGNTFNGSSDFLLLAFPGVILLSANLAVNSTPTFAQACAAAQGGGKILTTVSGLSVSGSAAGKRYSSDGNALISTGGAGANFFPGSIAGTTSNGGQYT